MKSLQGLGAYLHVGTDALADILVCVSQLTLALDDYEQVVPDLILLGQLRVFGDYELVKAVEQLFFVTVLPEIIVQDHLGEQA